MDLAALIYWMDKHAVKSHYLVPLWPIKLMDKPVMHKLELAFNSWCYGEILDGSLGSLLLVFVLNSSLLGDEHILSVSDITI
jgi:hypothetical protein